MLISLAKPGDVLFDVGAYVGWYSVNFAERVEGSRVYAFEPIDEIWEELKRNAKGQHNIACYPFGLSDKRGLVDFYVSSREPGTAALAPLEEERFGSNYIVRSPVTTIDLLCEILHLPPPNIIKCDVEGAELLVFRGAARTLEHYHPIIQCEMLRKWARRFNYHPNDLISYLRGFGYKCFTLADGELKPFTEMTEETTETNFFFLQE
jgi:FkbM family methyltransferase